MIRGTHAVNSGSYYFEVLLEDCPSENVHYRVGWASRFGELQGPVGYDKFSFGFRDVDGIFS